MKRKFLRNGALIFMLVIALVLLSSPSNAFWYGDQLPEAVAGPFGPMPPQDMTENYAALNEELHKPDGILGWLIVNTFFGTPPYLDDSGKPLLGLINYDHKKSWRGYTLLSSFGAYCPNEPCDPDNAAEWWYGILIDMEGNVINGWSGNPFPAKMLPGGHVLMAKGLQEELYQSPRFVQMDWCGNETWKWEGSEPWPCDNDNPRCVDGYAYTGQHHDWQREGNPVGYFAPDMRPKLEGKTLILSSTVPPQETTAHISNYRLISDAIYEVDSTTGETLWQWHDHEHFDDEDCITEETGERRPGCLSMGFDAVEKDGIMRFRAFIENDENASDYHHTNSASYLGPNKWFNTGKCKHCRYDPHDPPYYGHSGIASGRHKCRADFRFHPDNIIWDGRQSNITAIIARYDHPDGVTWKSHDTVWRVGPDYGPAHPEGKLGQIIGMHHSHMIPKGLPGAGHILIYDNGGMAGWGPAHPGMPQPVGYVPVPPPYNGFFGDEIHIGSKFRNYSRVIEFNPKTMKMVWEYKNLAPNNHYGRNMYSGFISGAQRLLNGNTLITEGQPGRVFEVTKKGKIVWEYINPNFGGPPQGPGAGANSVYRAYRIPYWWVHRKLLKDRNHDGVYDVCQ